jgi:hypothetical protein
LHVARTVPSIKPLTASIGTPDRAANYSRTDPMTTNLTRLQLLGGVAATPLFFLIALGLASTREGFDLRRHFLSQLSTCDLGWIQMANFVLVGGLYVLCAVAMARVVAPGRAAVWGPRLIGVFGGCLVAAGVFVADAANGYPVGYAEAEPTWHSLAHGIAALTAGLALTAAIFVFAARFLAQQRVGWAVFSALSGAVYFVLPWTNLELASLLLPVASVIGWGWVSIIAWQLAAKPSAAIEVAKPEPQPA